MIHPKVAEAFNAYLAARDEAGYEVVAFEITEAAGTYYLHRDDLFPLTLGDSEAAVHALRVSAFSVRNTEA